MKLTIGWASLHSKGALIGRTAVLVSEARAATVISRSFVRLGRTTEAALSISNDIFDFRSPSWGTI